MALARVLDAYPDHVRRERLRLLRAQVAYEWGRGTALELERVAKSVLLRLPAIAACTAEASVKRTRVTDGREALP